jgi:hypothetical protein
MLAVGSGDVWVNDDSGSRTLRLHNVLHVPRVASNIISVRGLLMGGLHVVYELDSVRVSLPGRFSISGTWDRDACHIPSTAVCARVRTSSSSDIHLWHLRFGHLGFGNLSRLGVEDMVTGFPTDISDEDWKFARREICQTCLIAKQRQLPYRTSTSICERPLQLVHMDVCGPMPVVAWHGEQYFVTLLDDYSKLSVVRVCKSKSDVVACVISVLKLLQTQSGCAAQRIRTDRGSEFFRLSSF